MRKIIEFTLSVGMLATFFVALYQGHEVTPGVATLMVVSMTALAVMIITDFVKDWYEFRSDDGENER